MSAKRIWLVDGVEKIGTDEAAEAAGSTRGSLCLSASNHEKKHGKGCVFTINGHTVQGLGRVNGKVIEGPVRKPIGGIIPLSMVDPQRNKEQATIPAPSDLLALELRGIKEQLRYTRECLLGGIHRVDEIQENLRELEARVIEEKKIRGSYHGGIGNVSEHLG